LYILHIYLNIFRFFIELPIPHPVAKQRDPSRQQKWMPNRVQSSSGFGYAKKKLVQ